ncbi:hypothetical protein GKZ90_0003405 [Flavobacterium sp. MC2016-06]|uniref:hypothetical protein n=1 Tax=Flavobacterium sp. MC2016-06 TaxID=2676308 RepID=UPI0018ACA11D|nr:hypothetical protein [Flavobacterium sp. MC2016-06]MBU3860586.1 hypothetical protein [Flavobacterium sp. MC2016-06]
MQEINNIEYPEDNSISSKLSRQQQNILDSQIESDKNLYKDAESIYSDLKDKYEL